MLETTLKLYLSTYNHSIPQRALHHQTPIQALKAWQEKKPTLFVKRARELTGLNTLQPPLDPPRLLLASASTHPQPERFIRAAELRSQSGLALF